MGYQPHEVAAGVRSMNKSTVGTLLGAVTFPTKGRAKRRPFDIREEKKFVAANAPVDTPAELIHVGAGLGGTRVGWKKLECVDEVVRGVQGGAVPHLEEVSV